MDEAERGAASDGDKLDRLREELRQCRSLLERVEQGWRFEEGCSRDQMVDVTADRGAQARRSIALLEASIAALSPK